MLPALLRALELLLAKVNADRSSDHKRQLIARELLRLYLDLRTLIDRGDAILVYLSGTLNERSAGI